MSLREGLLRSIRDGTRFLRRAGPGAGNGYSALANRFGRLPDTTLFVKVIVRPRTAEQFDKFEAAVGQTPGIVSAHRLAGSDDYLLEIRQECPVDLAKLKAETLEGLPGFVDCTVAVVARTAVSPEAIVEALNHRTERRWRTLGGATANNGRYAPTTRRASTSIHDHA